MEPENHMFEKENHLPNHHFWGSMLVFRGVFVNTVRPRGFVDVGFYAKFAAKGFCESPV